jgi:hypothetical protein
MRIKPGEPPKIKYKAKGKLKGKVAKDGSIKKPVTAALEAKQRLRAIPTGLPPEPAPEPVKMGRPTGYRPEMAAIAKRAMALGATRHELAEILQVNLSTTYSWAIQHEDFAEAIKIGTELSNDRVEASLYRKAVGFEFDSEKVAFGKDGEVLRAKTREVVHPDTGSAIFWLKNRRPDQWRERQENVNLNVTIEAAFDDFVRELQFKGKQAEIIDATPVVEKLEAAE